METTRLFIKLTRWNDWILNLLVVAAGYVISRPVIGESLGNLILFIIAFFLFESFGFAINDYFDAKSDSKNPKTKNLIAMGLIKKSHAMIFCIVFVPAFQIQRKIHPRHFGSRNFHVFSFCRRLHNW